MPIMFSYCNFSSGLIDEFKRLVEASSKIILLPHTGADGDAMFSARGMQLFLRSKGKMAEIVCMDRPKVDVNFSFHTNNYPYDADLVIAVDTANSERCAMLKNHRIPTINIDHHKSNQLYGELNIVDPVAGSACEVVGAILLKAYGREVISAEIAQSLLRGLLDDTLCFAVEGCGADTLKMASLLIDQGANFSVVKKESKGLISIEKMNVWNQVVASGQHFKDINCFLMAIDNKFLVKSGLSEYDFVGLINLVSQTIETDVVIIALEVKPMYLKISTRSKKTDSSAFCANFGGGGHKNASGARVAGMSLVNFAQKVKDLLKK